MMRIPTMIINLTGTNTEGIPEGGSADVAWASVVGLDTDYPFHYLGFQNRMKGMAGNGENDLSNLQETPGSWASSVVHLVTDLRSLA